MLKKAGIVVAGVALTLLSVSPLAFAGSKGGVERDRDNWSHHYDVDLGSNDNIIDRDGGQATGLVALGEVNALNNVNVCPPVNAGVNLGNVLGILGSGTVVNDQDAVAACEASSSEDDTIVDAR